MSRTIETTLYEHQIAQLAQLLDEADHILIGAAAGMSVAGGSSWYANDETYRKYFGHFEDAYQAGSVWNLAHKGFSNQPWLSQGHYWAFLVTVMKWVRLEPVYQPYLDLKLVLKGKSYDIVTTNQDHQFPRAFPEATTALIQGDWTYFQCSERCHDQVYPNSEIIDDLYEKIDGIYLEEELIPKCDHCGAPMREWIRGYEFLEGRFYQEQYANYQKAIDKTQGKRAVFLELGVGMMTPMFIKEPFMNLTYNNPQATYITINPKDALIPHQIQDQSLAIKEDIAKVLADLLAYQNQHRVQNA